MKELNKEILEFLEEIQEWMVENDYECGEQGGEIFNKITEILEENNCEEE